MRKSLLVGYYGMRNTGDDALMNATAWGAKRFLHTEQNLTSPIPLQLFSGEMKPATLVERQKYSGQNRLKQYLLAMESDSVIFGGGSVLHNSRDINLKRHLMALSSGRNHLAIGVGIGPFADLKAEKACKKFLEECRYVGLRDKESFEMAKAIAPNANVELSFDLAPLLLQNENFELSDVERHGIAVCLCPKERLSGGLEQEKSRLRRLANVLDSAQKHTGEEIYFVDFNGHESLGDRQVHQELASYLSSSTRYRFIEYDANPYRVLQRMASYKLAICMRLHASVFGFLTNTPVISLNYHRKCEAWCEQVGAPIELGFDASNFDPDALLDVINAGLETEFSKNQLTVNQAIQAAMKNWRTPYAYNEKNEVFSHHSFI